MIESEGKIIILEETKGIFLKMKSSDAPKEQIESLESSVAGEAIPKTKLNYGIKKIFNLMLICVGMAIVFWLFWGIVALRSTPCGFVARLKGSGCVRIFSRNAIFLAVNVYFNPNDDGAIYIDNTTVRYKSVELSLFSESSYVRLNDLIKENLSGRSFIFIEDFSLSPDQNIAAACVEYGQDGVIHSRIVFVNLKTNAIIGDLDDSEETFKCGWQALKFVPQTSILHIARQENSVANSLLVNPEDGSIRGIEEENIAFSMDGKLVASRLPSDQIVIHSFPEFKEIRKFGFPAKVEKLAFSANGKFILASDTEKAIIYMLEVDTGRLIKTFEAQNDNHAVVIAVSSDGSRLAATFSDSIEYSELYVWNLNDGSLVKRLNFHERSFVPFALEFSSNGNLLAVGTLKSVMIFDLTK